jgi:hypothetical protein
MSPRVRSIIKNVADRHGVRAEDIASQRSNRLIAWPRFDAAYQLRALTRLSYPQIASALGYRDHTNAIYANRRWPECAAKLGLPVAIDTADDREFHILQAIEHQRVAAQHLEAVSRIDRRVEAA